MAMEGLTITEYAKRAGLSARTIRRKIKSGSIAAVKVDGLYGAEYQITEPVPAPKPLVITTNQAIAMVRDLQKENLQLAGQLGAAQERIKALEGRLLTEGKKGWFSRLLGR